MCLWPSGFTNFQSGAMAGRVFHNVGVILPLAAALIVSGSMKVGSASSALRVCSHEACEHERCEGHTHKGHREKVLRVMKFRVFSGYFQGVFRVFSGSFRVFSACFSLCLFRVCPLDSSKCEHDLLFSAHWAQLPDDQRYHRAPNRAITNDVMAIRHSHHSEKD